MKYLILILLISFLSVVFALLSCKNSGPTAIDDAHENCESLSQDDIVHGKLVFSLLDSTVGPFGLYTMNVDGSELGPVAVAGDSVYLPGLWGGYYVFRSFLPQNPQWSPDGKKIMCEFSIGADGANLIMLMEPDGRNKTVLSICDGDAARPLWSPSGNKILFFIPGQQIDGIKIINISEENCFEMGKPSIRNPYLFQGDSLWFIQDFHWGPSDNVLYAIASVNKRPEEGPYIVGQHPENEIFAIDIDSGEVIERITNNQIDEARFRLSPDGSRVAFKRGHYERPNTFHILCLKDGTIAEFPGVPPFSCSWNWSSDGKSIVFAAGGTLYMLKIAGAGEFISLTSFQGHAGQPAAFMF